MDNPQRIFLKRKYSLQLTIIFFCFNSVATVGQGFSSEEFSGELKPISSNIAYSEIKGTAYHDERMMKGMMITDTGDTLIQYLRYNAFLDQMEYAEGGRISRVDDRFVDEVHLNGRVYKKGAFFGIDGLQKGYFIQLVSGECQLMLRDVIEYQGSEGAENSFHQAKGAQFRKIPEEYFYRRHSEVFKLLIKSRSTLEDLFQLEFHQFNGYVERESIKFRKEEDLVQLFDFMNEEIGRQE